MTKQHFVQTSRLYQREKGIKFLTNNNSCIPLKRIDRKTIYAMIKAAEVDQQDEYIIHHHPQSIMYLVVAMKLEREVIVTLIAIDRDVQVT